MFLKAPLIHDGFKFLPEGAVIEADAEGVIIAIHNHLESDDVLNFEGILCPGFVNVHCHLELSHLKGILPEKTGLIPFLKQIPPIRGAFTEAQIKTARHAAYEELLKNGVVAVGDIANQNDTVDLRALEKLHVHSFVECIGFTEDFAPQCFETSAKVFETFAEQEQKEKMLRQSIVPHAPYSVSSSLFKLIDQHQQQTIVSIHNQESKAENEYYQAKEGGVKELLATFGINDSFFSPSGKNSLETYSDWLSQQHSIILVHNTYSTEKDVQLAQQRFQNVYWCLCPNANLFIENQLPDVPMFVSNNATLCIGTDSLASNHQLSVLAELATLKKHCPELSWEQLLKWGTINGAKALNMEQEIGSIEPGKKPGLINISIADSDHPTVQRII